MKIKLNKNFLNRANSGLTIIIIIGILGVLNFFSYQFFYRLDLTQNKDYSISKISKNTAGQLEDVLTVKAYFSNNLPSQYLNLRQEVGDILEEYANYSGGKIKVEFIDPKDDAAIQRDLYLLGIPELQFNVLEKDKYQVVKGYLGIAVQYGDKKEVIPVVQNTGNLEYQITLAIKKVTNKIDATLGFVTSNGTVNINEEMSDAYKKLEELYKIRDIDLSKVKEIDSSVKTLIIAGPTVKFSDSQLKIIDKFLIKGGSILFLVDGVKIEEGLTARANELGLEKLFSSYGLKLNKDLVADTNSGMASFSQGYITFSTNYPFWPKVIKAGFDKTNVAVSKLESLILPWASSVEILEDKIDKENKFWHLAKTSDKAMAQTGQFNLNPESISFAGAGRGQYDLAVGIFGKFNSAFDKTASGNGRIILVGDSDFIRDKFVRGMPDNMIFFQNIVDSLSLDEDLINIRSEEISDRPLRDLSDPEKVLIRYLNIFGITVIVIAFGLVRYFLRRRKRAEEI